MAVPSSAPPHFDTNGRDRGYQPSGASKAHFTYDAVGRLITYDNGNATEHYYYDGVRRIQTIAILDSDGTTVVGLAEYVYGPDYVDEVIFQETRRARGTTLEAYVLQDANYNVVALTDTLGGVMQQYAWDPYGSPAASDQLVTAAATNRLGHQGLFFYAFDGSGLTPNSKGLYYNRNRWYSPKLGRFTTPDPNGTAEL